MENAHSTLEIHDALHTHRDSNCTERVGRQNPPVSDSIVTTAAYLEMRFNLRALLLLLVLLPRQYRNVAYNKIIINGLIGSATTASGGRLTTGLLDLVEVGRWVSVNCKPYSPHHNPIDEDKWSGKLSSISSDGCWLTRFLLIPIRYGILWAIQSHRYA